MSSRSFGNYVYDLAPLKEAVATYIAIAAEKLRAQGSVAGMIQVYIPQGSFQMGGLDPKAATDEKPVHKVDMKGYWIDKVEVTNSMYLLCLQAGECGPPQSTSSETRPSYFNNPEFNDFPVVNVTWDSAKKYCEWAGRRLPTEAEWEKAARGGLEGEVYPWGSYGAQCIMGKTNGAKFNNNANCKDTDTERVGSYAPNGYGALDMAGNVFEWVADWYDSVYYANSPEANPLGPDSGVWRVMRGGSWKDGGSSLSSFARSRRDPATADDDIGFRCAMDAE